MEKPKQTIARMKKLKEAGFSIFLDDFGTGQSSLAYLKDIPASTLKIDKSYVDPIVDDEDSRSYLKLILYLAENRGKETVVEGVETAEQLAILKEAGCRAIQGYYFSRPIPAEQFENLLIHNTILPLG
ncbi:MAG: EAL domain-containing protein [Spirochaetales bacterium]|nr:EAL domain-containing protein [Spirochaetales bacterium]